MERTTVPKATPQTAKYLKVTEVAEYLNLSTRAVYDLIAARELESSRFGTGRNGMRVLSASVLAFEKARRVPAASQ